MVSARQRHAGKGTKHMLCVYIDIYYQTCIQEFIVFVNLFAAGFLTKASKLEE
jgi:hypothetical protein